VRLDLAGFDIVTIRRDRVSARERVGSRIGSNMSGEPARCPKCNGGMVQVYIDIYLYGPNARAAALRDDPTWQAWLGERFPMPQMG
jgi:hypothetical protein